MALPPTIPTSFVPHPGGTGAKSYKSDLMGAFAFFAYGVLGVVVILALLLFAYGRVLVAQKSSKDAALAKAEASIDPATIEQFVRLRDRLTSSTQLLNQHQAFSAVLNTLGTLLPTTVQMVSLHLAIDSAGLPTLQGTGVAKSFNALAAASTAFAKDGRIKDVIFSNISVAKNGVSFSLAASIDPKLTAYTPPTALPQATVPTQTTAPTTASSSTPPSSTTVTTPQATTPASTSGTFAPPPVPSTAPQTAPPTKP